MKGGLKGGGELGQEGLPPFSGYKLHGCENVMEIHPHYEPVPLVGVRL